MWGECRFGTSLFSIQIIMAEKALTRKLNLGSVFKTWSKLLKADKSGFVYSGIYLFTGFQGSGKTLNLVHTVHYMHERFPKALIVSNINLIGIDYIPYTGIDDFKLKNGQDGIIYVIDEIQALFCSLESKKMPVSTITVWSQNRKNRRVILSTSQRFNRVAKAIREQCKFHIECRPPIGPFFRYRVLDAYLYDEEGNLPMDYKAPMCSIYIPKPKIMDSYDTMEVVKRNG